jgi:hypothetical protein
LKRVAPRHYKDLNILMATDDLVVDRKSLGIDWKEMPAMAVTRYDGEKYFYPEGKKVTFKGVEKWLENTYLRKISLGTEK